ncbi:Lrp/AsnC family transcriptional regulator [Kaustia mangrovi]|uniref:Lrp/AsnC family transcriptional regulator n=1 Tax=Kaustia mangrovi TaxID=2593653 RepID=A0A7S8HAA9_9HYPH|nr:Lrp/AsnC family transcriptional regulator [Kaustia mangrovi]QPC41367.1 Lrp/AsnC family transcriptional regulator [Kaustia mangrovi]
MVITDKDEELISLLKSNAREPVSSLARKMGVSRSTVQDRLRRLEERGIIAGYALKIGAGFEMSGLRAFVTISAEPGRAVEVAQRLGRFVQVESIHTVSGKFDMVALVRTRSAEDMDRVLDDIGLIAGVTRTESAVILSTKLDRRVAGDGLAGVASA